MENKTKAIFVVLILMVGIGATLFFYKLNYDFETLNFEEISDGQFSGDKNQANLRETSSRVGNSQVLSNNLFQRWEVFKTNNESIYYNHTITDDEICLIKKFTGTKDIIEPIFEEVKGETVNTENVTVRYYEPNSIKVVENKEGVGSKNETFTSSTRCFPLNISKTDFYKFGEESIIIVGDLSFNSVDLNVTQQPGYTHLNMTPSSPYDSIELYYSYDVDVFVIQDLSDRGRNSLNTGSTFEEDGGVYGSSRGFNGVNNSQNIGAFPSLGQDGTFSFWYRNDSAPNTRATLLTRGFNTYRFAHRDVTGSLEFIWQAGGTGSFDVSVGQRFGAQDEFAHIGLIVNNTNTYLFINGVNINNGTGTNTNADAGSLTFGARNNGFDRFLNGSLDEILIFNDALTVNQLLDIFNNQSAKFAHTGNQTFENINVSVAGEGGTENRLNITLTKYESLLNANVSASINGGAYFNFTNAGNLTELEFTDDPNFLNITFRYGASTNDFYTSYVIGNITLDSWTVVTGDIKGPSYNNQGGSYDLQGGSFSLGNVGSFLPFFRVMWDSIINDYRRKQPEVINIQ